VKKADSVHRAIGKAIDFVLVGILLLIPRVGILAAPLYMLIADGFFDGRSVGKKLVGLRVVLSDPSVEGRRCTFRQSLIRNLPYAAVVFLANIPIVGLFIILPLGVFFLAVEAYFVWADDRGVRVGDIYAGTQVIDDHPAS
jgi:uncharacterized RDD family membrane protein YckC